MVSRVFYRTSTGVTDSLGMVWGFWSLGMVMLCDWGVLFGWSGGGILGTRPALLARFLSGVFLFYFRIRWQTPCHGFCPTQGSR